MYGELYRRKDGKWSWRLRAENGKIIATDGAQGYENKVDAIKMFDKVKYHHHLVLTEESQSIAETSCSFCGKYLPEKCTGPKEAGK